MPTVVDRSMPRTSAGIPSAWRRLQTRCASARWRPWKTWNMGAS